MKSKFKSIKSLFVLSVLCLKRSFGSNKKSPGLTVSAEEKTKQVYESWAVNSIQLLDITNKFGEIRISDERTDSITIDVTITVEARDEKQADDLLDLLNVEFRKSGSTVYAVTKIENSFKRIRFSLI